MLQDPFFVVKEEVQQSVSGIGTLHKRWSELLQSSNTANNDEFSWTTNELKSGIRSIEWDLQDLEETVAIVEKNRQKFQLDDQELASRKKFIASTRDRVARIKADLLGSDARQKLERDERAQLTKQRKQEGRQTKQTSKYSKLEDAIHADNDAFINQQEQQQQLIMRDQDQGLDDLQQTVGNLTQIGMTINEELEQQAQMLDEFSGEVDDTTGRVDTAIKKVNKVIKETADGKTWCVICVLFLVVIVLLIVVTQMG